MKGKKKEKGRKGEKGRKIEKKRSKTQGGKSNNKWEEKQRIFLSL